MRRWFSRKRSARKPARPRSSRAPWTFEMLEPRLLLSADPLTTLQTEILTSTLSEDPEPASSTGRATGRDKQRWRRRRSGHGCSSGCDARLAFAFHALLARRLGLAGFRQCAVDDLDRAAALIQRDHDARARDA